MKKLIILLLLPVVFAVSSFSQAINTGALITDKQTYQGYGTAPLPIGSGSIPESADLSDQLPPAGYQSPQNSCVAWAAAYANYTYFNCRHNNKCNYQQGDGTINSGELFSPAFVYNQINSGQNRGTRFQDAFHIMQTQGVATMKTMPYIPDNWNIMPSPAAITEAQNYKIDTWRRLGEFGSDVSLETKAYLAEGVPVLVGVKVDNYFRKINNFPNPYVWKQVSGAFDGMAHAILIVGYNDNTRTFKFVNSWGQSWGNNGYGYISYDVFRSVLNEAYIIKPSLNIKSTNSELLKKTSNEDDAKDLQAGLRFDLIGVDHIPAGDYSPQFLNQAVMTFRGGMNIPAGLGRTARVAIYFYKDNGGYKGELVGSVNPQYRTIRGQAVTGAPLVNLDPTRPFNTFFFATMPYYALDVPKGYPYRPIESRLIAEPVLLVDGFPVRIGGLHHFFVNL